MQKPSRIYRCHSGEVTSLTGSPVNALLLSGGSDGKACIYDLNRCEVISYIIHSKLKLDISLSGVQW